VFGANSLQICQSPRGDSDDFARLLEQGVPLGLDCLQLGDHKLEPVEFASDLSFEMVRQDAAVARLQGVQPRSAVAMKRFVVDDALGKQKAFYAVYVLDRSASTVLRSRQIRRRSSSWGVGGLTMARTRGSPRLYAKSVRTRVSRSIVSVLARRRRREVKIDAGSATWLSMPSLSSTRWIQKPSSPASWITIIGKSAPARVRCEKRCRSLATFPPAHQGGFAERKAMIDRTHDLPISRQAKALNISRGAVYYKPRPVSPKDLELAIHRSTACAGIRATGSRSPRISSPTGNHAR
jgi:hypothetical protein